MDKIHVVGLGPGSMKYLSAEVRQLLASARHLALASGRHPAAAELRSRGIDFSDLEALATRGTPEESCAALVDSLMRLAAEHSEIVYAVLFSQPLDDPAARELHGSPDVETVLHPGPGEGRPASAAPDTPIDAAHVVSASDGTHYPTFEELVALMARLRGPDGCLWDREQTHKSLSRHLVEEAYEVVDAIERGSDADLMEELGDLALQIVFHAQIASDRGSFDVDDVLEGIMAKLIRRHPHIFSDVKVSSSADVAVNWERIKRAEKKAAAAADEAEAAHEAETSTLAGVPHALPSLMYAEKLQSAAARVGFDWEEYAQVVEKVKEELGEVVAAKQAGGDVEAELGDVLFGVVNLARFLDVDCETALRGVCARFISRFQVMEELAEARGVDFSALPLQEKEKLWQQAKQATGCSGSDQS